MFDDSGKKIKKIAEIVVYVNTIFGGLTGGLLCSSFFRLDGDKAKIAFLVGTAIFGMICLFFSWICSLVLAAFGELCENVYELNKKADYGIQNETLDNNTIEPNKYSSNSITSTNNPANSAEEKKHPKTIKALKK